jgi:hypothetical protein
LNTSSTWNNIGLKKHRRIKEEEEEEEEEEENPMHEA